MPAKDLGTKHVCFKCGTRFYDLKKPDPLCPKCGTDQRQNPALKAGTEKRRPAPRPAPAPAPVAAEEGADAPDVEDDGEADVDDEDDEDDDDDEP